jgi:hypothetical protein
MRILIIQTQTKFPSICPHLIYTLFWSPPPSPRQRLIGETEDAKIVGFNVTYKGFGYNADFPPAVTIAPAPGMNKSTTAKAVLAPTGRLLKVTLDSPFTGQWRRGRRNSSSSSSSSSNSSSLIVIVIIMMISSSVTVAGGVGV